MNRWPETWIASLASTLLGIGISVLSDQAFRGTAAEDFIAGLVGGSCGLLFAGLLERARSDSARLLVADIRQNDDLQALVDDARTARTFVSNVNNDKLQKLFADRYRELCRDAAWTELSQGRLAIPEYRELAFNRIGLHMCTSMMQAVSYQDESFWRSPEGRVFLTAQGDAIGANRRITRIFIFDSPITQGERSQLIEQSDLGIDVLILPLESVEEEDKLDFVIYDDIAVRVAQISLGRHKRAMLHTMEREVRNYLDRYRNLQERSIRLADYLASNPPAVDII